MIKKPKLRIIYESKDTAFDSQLHEYSRKKSVILKKYFFSLVNVDVYDSTNLDQEH